MTRGISTESPASRIKAYTCDTHFPDRGKEKERVRKRIVATRETITSHFVVLNSVDAEAELIGIAFQYFMRCRGRVWITGRIHAGDSLSPPCFFLLRTFCRALSACRDRFQITHFSRCRLNTRSRTIDDDTVENKSEETIYWECREIRWSTILSRYLS